MATLTARGGTVFLLGALFCGGALPARADSAAAPAKPGKPACGQAQTTIRKMPNGGYWADGYINNSKARLHIDTGADVVVVPLPLARSAGLEIGRQGRAVTASDTITIYRTVIPSLRIGDLTFYNVKADVNPRAPQNDQVLLGMTALASVSLHQENGVMVLSADTCGQTAASVTAAAGAAPAEPRLVMKRSLKDCLGPDKVVDAKVLECMKGLSKD